MPILIITVRVITTSITTKHKKMRWITAAAILSICSVTVLWGWKATQFAEALIAVSSDTSKNASLSAWDDTPGLGAEARKAFLVSPAVVTLSARAHATKVAALIAAHPVTAQSWLSMASDQLALGAPSNEIDASILMSRVSGPNDGSIMWQRGIFQAMRWQALSPDARQQTAADLADALNAGIVDDRAFRFGKAILTQQEAQIRGSIANALAEAGVSPGQIALIGLKRDSD